MYVILCIFTNQFYYDLRFMFDMFNVCFYLCSYFVYCIWIYYINPLKPIIFQNKSLKNFIAFNIKQILLELLLHVGRPEVVDKKSSVFNSSNFEAVTSSSNSQHAAHQLRTSYNNQPLPNRRQEYASIFCGEGGAVSSSSLDLTVTV